MQPDKSYKRLLKKILLIEIMGEYFYTALSCKTSDRKLKSIYSNLAINEKETAQLVNDKIVYEYQGRRPSNKIILSIARFVFNILPEKLLIVILRHILKRGVYNKWFDIHKRKDKYFWNKLLVHEIKQWEMLNSLWSKEKEVFMDKEKLFKLYFWVVGVYDVALGGIFVLFYRNIYAAINTTLPNHPGYIYVPALFLISGGIGEFLTARNLLRNVDLVKVRLLMKLSFAGAIFYCYFQYGVPTIFLLISILSIIGVINNMLFIRWANSVSKRKRI